MTLPVPTLLPTLAAEAVDNLRAVAQRSALALIGIVIGTAAVIAMLNVGHNAEAESIRQFQAMGTDLVVAQAGRTTKAGHVLRAAAVERMADRDPSLKAAAPLAISGTRLGRGEGVQASLVGATPALAAIARLNVAEGRFLATVDRDETFAVVGARIARSGAVGGAPLHPGDLLRLGTYRFTIVGVLAETAHNPLLPFDANEAVILPLASIRRVSADSEPSTILASAAEGIDPGVAATSLAEQLAVLRGGQRVMTTTARQLLEGMQRQARIMSVLLAAIGAISLLVGGVGVMNVMLMNVAERRREIGLRLALGARRGHVRTMFLLESGLLSMAGGLGGTVLGMASAYAYAVFSDWIFTPSVLALPLGAAISAGVGVFFGAYPAARAAGLDPIECLRAE